MERIKPPPELDLSRTNLDDAWKEWKEGWELYDISSGLSSKDTKVRVATLQCILGVNARRVLKTLPDIPEKTDERTVDGIVNALQNYCIPRKNVTYERYVFRMMSQGDQVFDNFLTELRRQANLCEFSTIKESLIRDQIIIGTNNGGLRERLLRESDLTLEKTITLCRISEQSKEHCKVLNSPSSAPSCSYDINSIKKNSVGGKQTVPSESTKNMINSCKFCGLTHERRKCPAYGNTCYNCQGQNHFSRCCPKKTKDVRTVELGMESNNEDINQMAVFIDEIDSSINIVRKNIQSDLIVSEIPINFKLDTGAECNILPQNIVDDISNCDIKPANLVLKSFGGHSIDTLGKCLLDTKLDSHKDTVPLEYYIVRQDVKPLLGLESCLRLGLISVSDNVHSVGVNVDSIQQQPTILDEFHDVFTGLGCVDGTYDIMLNENVTPTIQPQRNVPLRLVDKLRDTLSELEKQNVIIKVEEPVEWVSNLVIVEKKDKSLRLCLDPPDLNNAIKREDYRPPSFEKISSTLNGCKLFTVVDMSNCYWHQTLTDRSSFLCTFNTPFGRFRFKRMPFGISCASEVAQKMVEKHFGDIEGVLPIYDDIIIAGKTESEHDDALRKVLSRARERNIKFNKAKIQFRVNRVKYMGEMVGEEGFSADPDKISAILHMPPPKCKKDLQRLLGMINYLSKYISNMSELTSDLRSLLKDDVNWSWQPEHEAALVKLKNALTRSPVLRFYDLNLPTILQVDASKNGLGACLMQNDQPVAYASRSLTDAEQNYAQIEKELLAIVFGCERFHMYTYGTEINVMSDHKPLEVILKKPLHKIPPRLQRMRLRLQKYRLKVRYVPGKFLYIADTLSRAFLDNSVEENNMHEEMEAMIHSVTRDLPISDAKLIELRQEIANDETMRLLSTYAQEGWPNNKHDVPLCARNFWNVRNEIYIVNGLIMKDNRLVIPTSWRPSILQKIHSGHFGVEKCKAKARNSVFWPNMTKEIENLISNCESCLKFQNKQPKEPMFLREIPRLPWQMIGSDICEYKNANYLIVIDYFSKYIEATKLQGKKASDVIKCLSEIFSRHGYPETLFADNVPYNSQEMRNYADSCAFKIETISPTYSQSNGLAEKAVHIVKNILRKNGDLNEGLMEYRNTPISNFPYSPNQMLFSRRVKTKLPVYSELLVPDVKQDVYQLLQDRQKKTKQFYDRGSRDLPKVTKGSTVRFMKPGNKFYSPALVTRIHDAPRSFVVSDESGKHYRRNRRDLHLSSEPPLEIRQEVDHDISEPELMGSNNNLSEQGDIKNCVNPEIRRSVRVSKPPVWHQDYVLGT